VKQTYRQVFSGFKKDGVDKVVVVPHEGWSDGRPLFWAHRDCAMEQPRTTFPFMVTGYTAGFLRQDQLDSVKNEPCGLCCQDTLLGDDNE
jgi:hypothetical protein